MVIFSVQKGVTVKVREYISAVFGHVAMSCFTIGTQCKHVKYPADIKLFGTPRSRDVSIVYSL